MTRRITVNKKLIKAINQILEEESSISNCPEFLYYSRQDELFTEPPENWTELENAIYEHTERVKARISQKLNALLTWEEEAASTPSGGKTKE